MNNENSIHHSILAKCGHCSEFNEIDLGFTPKPRHVRNDDLADLDCCLDRVLHMNITLKLELKRLNNQTIVDHKLFERLQEHQRHLDSTQGYLTEIINRQPKTDNTSFPIIPVKLKEII